MAVPRKLIIRLNQPKVASNDCLPHAAMNLGSTGGSGTRPMAGMVSKLVVEAQLGVWVLYRMDADGGFVGDTWHDTREDALRQIQLEFGIDPAPYDVPPAPVAD